MSREVEGMNGPIVAPNCFEMAGTRPRGAAEPPRDAAPEDDGMTVGLPLVASGAVSWND